MGLRLNEGFAERGRVTCGCNVVRGREGIGVVLLGSRRGSRKLFTGSTDVSLKRYVNGETTATNQMCVVYSSSPTNPLQ